MIEAYKTSFPKIDPSAWVHKSAVIIGKVTIGEASSVWPNATIRGDLQSITIGARTNVQDNTVIHIASESLNPPGYPTIIGDDVTIGHSAIVHACTIGNRVLVGMGSVVLDASIIEDDVIIGAHSLVPMGKRLESGYLYIGSPIKQVRPLTEKEKAFLIRSARDYADSTAAYSKEG